MCVEDIVNNLRLVNDRSKSYNEMNSNEMTEDIGIKKVKGASFGILWHTLTCSRRITTSPARNYIIV